MYSYWLSSRAMTFGVETDGNGIITVAAPIARKFIGQPLSNLERWMMRQGGFRKAQLTN